MIVILILMAALLVFGFPVVFAKQNAIKIEIDWKHNTLKKEWHQVNVILWIVSLTTFSVAFHVALGWDRWWLLIIQIGLFLIFARFVYWLLFDIALNWFRSLPIWYETPDKENSNWDNVSARHGDRQLAVKLTYIVSSAIAYIISFII